MTQHDSLDELGAALSGAATDATESQLLGALAAIKPLAALRWLLRHPAAATAPIVNAVARAAAQSAAADELAQFLEQFSHLLAADAAQEVLDALRGNAPPAQLDSLLQRLLDRAPTNPGLLRAGAEVALATGAHLRAHDLLNRLVRSDPRLANAQFAYRMRERLPGTGHAPVRIALLSSFTIDPLAPFIDVECRLLGLEPRLYVAPFNTWEREVLGEGSGLQQFEPQIVFLSVAADDLLPELATAVASNDLLDAGIASVDRLLAAAARLTAWSQASLIVHGLHTAFRDPLGAGAMRSGPGRTEIIAQLNARLAQGLRDLPRAYLLDVGDVLTRRQHGPYDNPKMRHFAKMRFSEAALVDLGRAYAQFIAPLTGRTRKCVVVDLDNTLWGGIVGEDGPHGIRLGDTAPGSEYREFQKYLLTLTQRGILLAVNSKNNAADALEVIRSHESMVLREGAFSALRINWENKPSNMRSLAEELNLGLDAFVFLDDSDKERALMRQALPEVLTVDMPRDPALYRETLERLPELQTLVVTDEDRARTRQYAERRQREELRVSAQSVEEYLGSLGIVAEMARASERTLPRIQQLFQRTNQFNLTGKRYELGTLTAHASEAGWRIYATQVRDRFGDHGLVATALVRVTPDAWVIDNLVLSCRVIGYGVENALLAQVGADARNAKARWLTGEFIATAKNAPARDFFARNAFLRDSENGSAEHWRRDVAANALAAPAWITVKAAE